jgi:hypothetical protein
MALCLMGDGFLWDNTRTLCYFKNVTGLACPSCGATRSLACLLHGQILESLWWNPMGLILFSGMVLIPCLLLYDYLSGKEIYLSTYTWFEKFMLKKPVLYLFVSLVAFNWIWNIHKGL